VDFHISLDSVAQTVQPITDDFLKNLWSMLSSLLTIMAV
jgi:hypothetical protein